ncbi:iron ABC transporter permease [Alkalimonas sp. NCh-2]|uniref:FecCD family ABC transporter permease n=1 Tax=Alkalimonas sp. NCh-2 TaxID=3144846 RepID=UPI0031F69214
MARAGYFRWLLALVALLFTLLMSIRLGSAALSYGQIWHILTTSDSNATFQAIIWQIRLPRIAMAFFAGAGLAICGALLQNMSRNPLADPYLFGLTAGAGLGASLSMIVFPEQQLPLALSAFVGASLAVLLVVLVCIRHGWQQLQVMLLAGVAVSFMLSAISSFILYFAEPFAANRVIFWLMGSLSRSDWHGVAVVAPAVLCLLLVALAFRRQLDAMLLHDESARTLGVSVERVRLFFLLGTSAVTAFIVAQCGGIAFVGLMIPHLVRQWFGVTMLPLLLGSALVGGIFLIWVDNFARSLFMQQEIPLGVITSLLGSVFFLLLLRRQQAG